MSQTETGTEWLTRLLDLMGYPSSVTSEIKATNGSDPEESINYWLTIDSGKLRPHQIQALVGTDGVNIDAMQYLANIALNLHHARPEDHYFYTIELNGYRAERLVVLQQIAEQAAKLVRETHKECELKDLSAAERRQVHTILKDYPDLETFSQGKEPHRHLIVRLRQE